MHIVFIRHTSTAAEVDEETFFRGTETGGTVISTALDEMLKVVRDRYSPADWNIYAAQASDGDNFHDDMPRCLELLDERDPARLPVFRLHRDRARRALQRLGGDAGLARLYGGRRPAQRNFAMRRVAAPEDIYPGVPRAVLGRRRRAPEGGNCEVGTRRRSFPSARATCARCSTGPEWSFELIRKVYDAMGEIALGELGLDIYPNQIEVITAEQMLDSYSSIGMPLMYRHWSFGKRFARDEAYYKRGMRSLAYELVINSDPCISYIMEENSMTMQALVLAHAAYGHNHFFKNNYQFQLWTQPDHIIDYLAFAKTLRRRVRGAPRPGRGRERARCRARPDEPGRQPRSAPASAQRRQAREGARSARGGRTRRRPTTTSIARCPRSRAKAQRARPRRRASSAALGLPEENLLYFLEKNAPKLEDWQRELLRIVRLLSQYFYPQRQTKMMNEGCATFVHYEIMNRLYERGQLTDGTMLEFLHSHSSVIFQPAFNDRRFSGLNPYALGFAMMNDIKRICDRADRRGPRVVPRDRRPRRLDGHPAPGLGRVPRRELRAAVPEPQADPRLPAVRGQRRRQGSRHGGQPRSTTSRAISDVRRRLSRHYDVAAQDPDLQVTDADLSGSRRLVLTHRVRNGVLLDKTEAERTLQYLAQLWGYRVKLVETETSRAAACSRSTKRCRCPGISTRRDASELAAGIASRPDLRVLKYRDGGGGGPRWRRRPT